MTDFFRFPRTPHLAWLGEGRPRHDKLLPPEEASALLACELIVEEKVDGANLGISVGDDGTLRAQNRGHYLPLDAGHGQWRPLARWMAARQAACRAALSPGLLLFGEWCYAVHGVRYDRLPDWFLAFDVYDRTRGEFWSVARRDALARALAISTVPRLATGHFDLAKLEGLLATSRIGAEPAEGLYLRDERGDRLVARAKLVRSEFVQSIDEHWSKRALRTNHLAAK